MLLLLCIIFSSVEGDSVPPPLDIWQHLDVFVEVVVLLAFL